MVKPPLPKSRGKKPASPWSALAGVSAARDRLIAAIGAPVRRAAIFARLGVRPATGTLVYGPAGMGKSRLVRAVAEDAGIKLVALQAADLLACAPGEGEKVLRDAFSSARASAPALLHIDELDLLAPARVANMGDGQRNDRLIYSLIAEIDRVAGVPGVFVIGTTSRPNIIDPALLRPGRIDELVYVPIADLAGRAEILKLHTAAMPLATDADVAVLAERCDRFTVADIEDLIRRAGFAAISRQANAKSIAMADFETALAETRASVTEAMEKDYEKVQGEMKQNALKLEPMGFLGAGQLKPVRDIKHGSPERS